MNNSKGFTLVELMVAAGLLGLALAGAMSFFVWQSQKGADSTRLRVARENLTFALMLIQRDIMAAGFGVSADKTLSLVLKSNYGVDKVSGNQFNSTDTTFRPDKLHVGYGTFLDMNFDVNGSNDTNTVFRYSATKNIGSAAVSQFSYDMFPIEMAVTTDAKPLGGFICGSCTAGQPDAGDVDWQNTGSRPPNTKPWLFKLSSGSKSNLSGNVAPSIVYRIAQDSSHRYVHLPEIDAQYELQRNGVRVAGGDPDLEVYNLKVSDLSTTMKRSFSIRIDYQVKLGGSLPESGATQHGTAKQTWYKTWVTIEANPRVILLNGG